MVGNNKWKKKIKQREGLETAGGQRVSVGCSEMLRKASLRSREPTLPEDEVGGGGAFPTEKQVQRVLSILFLYIAHFSTVQG